MRTVFTLRDVAGILFITAFSLLGSNNCLGQLITYTNDTGGVMNTIATHVTADTLKRVNGSLRLSPQCTHGFSTKGFTNNTTYSDTLKAVQVTISPNSGYFIRVDSFKVDLRNSPTGPSKARFAYSINGGTTWIDQGTDQIPFPSGTCDSMVTCRWVHTVALSYSGHLMFRVYGFNTSVTTGTGNMQIMNLNIYGAAFSSAFVTNLSFDEQSFNVFPNPVNNEATISYRIAQDSKVCMKIYDVVGREVTTVIDSPNEEHGDHSYTVPVSAPGIYFVRLWIDNQMFVKKIIRL